MQAILPNLQAIERAWKIEPASSGILVLPPLIPVFPPRGFEVSVCILLRAKHPVASGTKSCPQLQKLPALGSSREAEALDSTHASCFYLPCDFEIAAGSLFFYHLYNEQVSVP
jgi:hypothetical protein